MYFFYSILLTAAFILLSPLFIARRSKYAAGFFQRLGKYPEFVDGQRPVIWLHCVSVGEVNAARPLVDEIAHAFSGHRLVISTTTKTGQDIARNVFGDKADAIFYFPFDWKFAVRRALRRFRPSLVLLVETEIWPRFIYETHKTGCRVAIVNGRLSERSARRYARMRFFVRRVLGNIDLALMQNERDAERIISIGAPAEKVVVTGNIKFDIRPEKNEIALTRELRQRFGIDDSRSLILAASTHEPEELLVLRALFSGRFSPENRRIRLMIAPRHPERFASVAETVLSFCQGQKSSEASLRFSRRSVRNPETDPDADIILLDSIGELRSAYPLAEIVFVGGSLIPHGGQSVLEPASVGNAIITGPFTHNFAQIIAGFLTADALFQLSHARDADQIVVSLRAAFDDLLANPSRRSELGSNAIDTVKSNRGAVEKSIAALRKLPQLVNN